LTIHYLSKKIELRNLGIALKPIQGIPRKKSFIYFILGEKGLKYPYVVLYLVFYSFKITNSYGNMYFFLFSGIPRFEQKFLKGALSNFFPLSVTSTRKMPKRDMIDFLSHKASGIPLGDLG